MWYHLIYHSHLISLLRTPTTASTSRMNNLQPPHDPSAPWANRYSEDRGPQSMIQTRQSCAELNLPLSPRSPGGSVHSANVNGYYLDRGNGQYTRLLPADKLPPMNDVSPRETRHDNMVILPPLTANPDQGRDYGHGAQVLFTYSFSVFARLHARVG